MGSFNRSNRPVSVYSIIKIKSPTVRTAAVCCFPQHIKLRINHTTECGRKYFGFNCFIERAGSNSKAIKRQISWRGIVLMVSKNVAQSTKVLLQKSYSNSRSTYSTGHRPWPQENEKNVLIFPDPLSHRDNYLCLAKNERQSKTKKWFLLKPKYNHMYSGKDWITSKTCCGLFMAGHESGDDGNETDDNVLHYLNRNLFVRMHSGCVSVEPLNIANEIEIVIPSKTLINRPDNNNNNNHNNFGVSATRVGFFF